MVSVGVRDQERLCLYRGSKNILVWTSVSDGWSVTALRVLRGENMTLSAAGLHARWVALAPQHGASSGCKMEGRAPVTEGSCEYIQ
jgi:hypothetical protein